MHISFSTFSSFFFFHLYQILRHKTIVFVKSREREEEFRVVHKKKSLFDTLFLKWDSQRTENRYIYYSRRKVYIIRISQVRIQDML